MAKKQLKKYIFTPGVSSEDTLLPNAYDLISSNLDFIKTEATAFLNSKINSDTAVNFYPNAVELLTLNKAFIKDEVTAWIASRVAGSLSPFVGFTYSATKCKRDVGYILDAYIHDIRYGGNEQTCDTVSLYWENGVAQIDGNRAPEVAAHEFLRTLLINFILPRVAYTSLQGTPVSFQNTTGLGSNGEAIAVTKVTSLATIVKDVIANGDTAIPVLPSVVYPSAVKLLKNNKQFMIDEVVAWIANQVASSTAPFAGYTYNSAKCKRDVGYILDAYIYDVAYGGNEKTVETVQMYWLNGIAQVDGDRAPEVEAHVKLAAIINDYILPRVAYTSLQTTVNSTQNLTAPSGEAGAISRITILSNAVINVIESGLGSLPSTTANSFSRSTRDFAEYVFTQSKCERDVGYVLDAYLNDLRYGGNRNIRRVVSFYWNGNTPQIDGDRLPEIVVHTFIRDLINNHILVNRTQTSPYQGVIEQTVDLTKTAEPAIFNRVTTLAAITTEVIANGLTSIPALEDGVGLIKVQGRVELSDLLLITNTRVNEVIYNFTDALLGATIEYFVDADDDFPTFLQTTDTVSVITLKATTTGHLSTDPLQIFIEVPEMKVRPYDFGTDAIERHRMAAPQSMLDADFEYGLQPTKWQAIGMERGYPSIYEIPGSDLQVSSVSSDASAATLFIGSSLITVTTVSPHGLSAGNPITIKGLGVSVTGFSRAEGSFIINSTPTTTTLTYYATSKVGTVDPTTLATTYTQLRQGGFYTGANIGTPSFSIISQGTGGTLTAQLNTLAGSDTIPFTGAFTPTIGSPIVATGIPNGTQVTAVQGTGGISTTKNLVGSIGIGDVSFEVDVATGILPNMAVNDGSGNALLVSNVVGTTVSVTGQFSTEFIGSIQSYLGVVGSNVAATGSGARFNVTRTAGVYTVTINAAGTGYQVGGRLKIDGAFLGGSLANNITVTVDTVGGSGNITAISYSGVGISGNDTYISSAQPVGAKGSGATFSINKSAGAYSGSITVGSAGTGYILNDRIKILGSFLGGSNDANDCIIKVTGVSGGAITSVTFSGAAFGTGSYTAIGGVNFYGTGAEFNVERTNGVYYITSPGVSNGQNYLTGELYVITGFDLGGTSPANDLTVTILDTDLGNTSGGLGNPTRVSISGTAAPRDATYTNQTSSLIQPVGINSTFDITRDNGVYTSVTVSVAGTGYVVGDKIKILGSNLDGTDLTNDLTITITDAGVTGDIIDFTTAGTAYVGVTISFYSTLSVNALLTGDVLNGTLMTTGAIALAQVSFSSAHGLVPGNTFLVKISSTGTNHTLLEGPFFVEQVPSISTIRFTARAPGVIDVVSIIQGTVYPRPDSYFIHRPYDGGVQLGTGGPQHGAQAIRQSKKYIRYQSGKGIMYTTGALFAPSYDLKSVTAYATTVDSEITVETDDVDHGLQVGGGIRLIGIVTSGYNGDYVVEDIVTERIFKVRSQNPLGSTVGTLGEQAQVSVRSWHGATVRAGTFDDQNGIFWQYDGQYLAVVKRSSAFQLAGTISINADSNAATGTGTRFRDQLKSGDRIVIKGMTHVVTSVASDTAITVAPDYRGVRNATSVKLCKVVDLIVRQEDFNLDTLDGTGPSGYDLDITKMQMIGIQYSWYGAGFIDFMLRGSNGNFTFAHRIRNSNVNTEAFMRTGNMPVRYEVTNESASGRLFTSITSTQTTMLLADATFFPPSGIIYVDNELIRYTGKTGNLLTGCTRATTYSLFVAGANRSFTADSAIAHSANTGVVLISNTISPIISHWGSAFLTDGGFDQDRGYIFNYASTGLSITTTKQTAFLIRLAPSVSNAIIGDLGDRELLNRAQLLLKAISITSETGTGGIVVEGVLNPQNYPVNPSNITWNGLSGLSAGGQPSFAQIAPGGSVSWNSGVTTTTATATTSAALTASITIEYTTGRNNYAYIRSTTWVAANAVSGDSIATSDTKFAAGTFITGATNYGSYWFITFNRASVSDLNANGTITLARGGTQVRSNFLYFTTASWISAAATNGTEVSVGETKFPAGTRVSGITLETFGGSQHYKVTFTQSSTATIAPAATVEFQFGQPPFALPGEQVFSFISNPGSTDTLDLGELKELTTTSLGGRGTYPNGPDVLAINVYKVSGTAISSNIVLRWGEAQA
jgi:hypothetical protein